MKNNSFMEVIKTGKIAVLVSEPGKGTVSFLRSKIKEDYPDVYTAYVNVNVCMGLFELKEQVDEENAEIVVFEGDCYDNDTLNYVESLKDKMGVIMCVHNVPERTVNNMTYVQYAMDTKNDKEKSYYGE